MEFKAPGARRAALRRITLQGYKPRAGNEFDEHYIMVRLWGNALGNMDGHSSCDALAHQWYDRVHGIGGETLRFRSVNSRRKMQVRRAGTACLLDYLRRYSRASAQPWLLSTSFVGLDNQPLLPAIGGERHFLP